MSPTTLGPDTERRLLELALQRGLITDDSVHLAEAHARTVEERSLVHALCAIGHLDRRVAAGLLREVRATRRSPPDRGTQRNPLALAGGSLLGPYRILSLLGRGGMGVVYRAHDERLRRDVALKAIAGVADAEALERFVREARAAGRIRHPGVVSVYGAEVHDGIPVIALELVEGVSLAKELATEGPRPPEWTARLIHALALAVQSAHEEGVVHRDLKPANVLLDREGRPRLTDFGLARDVHATAMTATGDALGTPAYMAPEQALGQNERVEARTDVYGLGAVLYHALAGRPPFDGGGMAVLRRVVDEEPAPPSRERLARGLAAVPRDLETICLRCLEKAPERRYESARALADDLDRYLRGVPIASRRAGILERTHRRLRRRPGLTLGAVAVVAAALLSAGLAAESVLRERRAALDQLKNQARDATTRFDAARRAKRLVYDPDLRTEMFADIVLPGVAAMLATGHHAYEASAAGDASAATATLEAREVAWDVGVIARELAEWDLAVTAFDRALALGRGAEARAARDESVAARARKIATAEQVDVLRRQVEHARQRGERAWGLELAGRLESVDGGSSETWLLEASIASGLPGRQEDALRYVERSLALKPAYVEALKIRAVIHGDLARFADARADITRALELRPKDLGLRLTRANYSHRLLDVASARADLDLVLAVTADPFAYNSRCELSLLAEDLPAAIEDATKAIAIAPGFSSPWIHRADAHARRHELDEALADIDSALERECYGESRAEAVFLRGTVRHARSEPAAAIADYDEYLRLSPAGRHAGRVREYLRVLRGR